MYCTEIDPANSCINKECFLIYLERFLPLPGLNEIAEHASL